MNKRLLVLLSVLVLASMILAACGTPPAKPANNEPPATEAPNGPTAEDCAETETHMAEVVEMAKDNKKFYESTVKTRKSAEYLVAGNFGFEIKDLDAPMPSTPSPIMPFSPPSMKCSTLSVNINLAVAGKALDVTTIYLNAAAVENAIGAALLKMMDMNDLSLEQYNDIVKQAIESVPPPE